MIILAKTTQAYVEYVKAGGKDTLREFVMDRWKGVMDGSLSERIGESLLEVPDDLAFDPADIPTKFEPITDVIASYLMHDTKPVAKELRDISELYGLMEGLTGGDDK